MGGTARPEGVLCLAGCHSLSRTQIVSCSRLRSLTCAPNASKSAHLPLNHLLAFTALGGTARPEGVLCLARCHGLSRTQTVSCSRLRSLTCAPNASKSAHLPLNHLLAFTALGGTARPEGVLCLARAPKKPFTRHTPNTSLARHASKRFRGRAQPDSLQPHLLTRRSTNQRRLLLARQRAPFLFQPYNQTDPPLPPAIPLLP
jgi:hypothetical protein